MNPKRAEHILKYECLENYVINKGLWNEWRLGTYLDFCYHCDSGAYKHIRFIELDKIYIQACCEHCGKSQIYLNGEKGSLELLEDIYFNGTGERLRIDVYADFHRGSNYYENGWDLVREFNRMKYGTYGHYYEPGRPYR